MAILATDIVFRLSGGGANTDPNLALGGAKSSTDAAATILDDVNATESSSGDTEYRCIYVHNNHGSLTLTGAKIWILANTASTSTDISIGLGTSALGGTESAIADENTAPAGVTFTNTAVTSTTALALGNIPAGSHKAVWIRRVVNASAPASNDTFTLRVQGDTAA